MGVKGKTFPDEIYLVRGSDGKGHFYSSDPLRIKDKKAMEIDIASVLFDFFGPADIINPLVLKVGGIVHERGEKFTLSAPARVRSGELAKHFEDFDGHIVEIMEMISLDPAYPVNGIVLSRDGKLIEQRLYDGEGNCRDGQEFHRLVVVDKPLLRAIQDEGHGVPDAAGGKGEEENEEE